MRWMWKYQLHLKMIHMLMKKSKPRWKNKTSLKMMNHSPDRLYFDRLNTQYMNYHRRTFPEDNQNI